MLSKNRLNFLINSDFNVNDIKWLQPHRELKSSSNTCKNITIIERRQALGKLTLKQTSPPSAQVHDCRPAWINGEWRNTRISKLSYKKQDLKRIILTLWNVVG